MTFQKLFSLLKANDQASQRKINQDKRAVKATCKAYSKLKCASTGKAASAAVVTSFTTLSTAFAMSVVMLVIIGHDRT